MASTASKIMWLSVGGGIGAILFASTDDGINLKLGARDDLSYKLEELQKAVKGIKHIAEHTSMELKSISKTDSEAFEQLYQKLKPISEADADAAFRQLVNHVTEEIKRAAQRSDKNDIIPYVMQAAIMLAFGYGCMYMMGVTVSDVWTSSNNKLSSAWTSSNKKVSSAWKGTKRSMARGLSNMTKHLCQKSAAITDAMRSWTEKIESSKLNEHHQDQNLLPIQNVEPEMLNPTRNEGAIRSWTENIESSAKLDEHHQDQKVQPEMLNQTRNEVSDVGSDFSQIDYDSDDKISSSENKPVGTMSKVSKTNPHQEYSDLLYGLVMEEGKEFDEDLLGKAFDYLNENHVAARGFVSKRSNMRKKWLVEFADNWTVVN